MLPPGSMLGEWDVADMPRLTEATRIGVQLASEETVIKFSGFPSRIQTRKLPFSPALPPSEGALTGH